MMIARRLRIFCTSRALLPNAFAFEASLAAKMAPRYARNQNKSTGRFLVTMVSRLILVLAALALPSAALAQSYPEHPVKMIVGFAPGGPTDVIARIVADKLSASLGKQFYVLNQPGAGSNT